MSNGPRPLVVESPMEAAVRVDTGPPAIVKDLQQLEAFSKFKDGAVVHLRRDPSTPYVLEHVHPTAHGVPQGTIRRLVPKLSKAEKKAARKARRQRPGGLL